MHMADVFGYEFQSYLATRPEKSIGDAESLGDGDRGLCAARWRFAVCSYKIDEGGGAFYGPKIDIKWVDALGREWTGPTIQVDFNLPERFDVNYIGEDGERHRAAMIHRTLLGSMERFVGGLVEHYAGAFPLWLAPVQVGDHPDHRRADRLRARRGQTAHGRGASHRSQRPARPHAGQDPGSAIAEDPVHAGDREARGGGGRGSGSPAQWPRPGRDAGRAFLELALPRVESRSLYLDDVEEAEAREAELAAAAAS